MEKEISSDSWLMRPRFSRAIYYRTNSLVNAPIPSLSTLFGSSKRTDSSTGPPISAVQHASSQDAGCVPASQGTCESAGSVSKVWNECCEVSEAHADFSFPSPFSSSTSRRSDYSVTSKCTSDCFSPARDHEGLGADPCLMATSPNSSSCSMGSVDTYPSTRPSSAGSVFADSCSERHSLKNFGSEDGSERGGRSDVRRIPSWSQFFARLGGERAVLSAEEWMVDLSQLLLGERFACGNHSRLYRGVYKGSPVAVKVIKQPDDDGTLSYRLEQIFTQEVTTLSDLRHRNVIRFIAACKKNPVLCVITEYLSGGSLRSYLHKRDGRPLPTSEIVRMALDIAAGMEYLHMKGVFHRDLKSENLVLSEDGCLKIVDFGVSCFESKCDYRAADPGTYRWMAPEMLQHKPYTRKVDVYSFGIVLWELVTTRLPYGDMSAVQAAFSVLHKDHRPPIPPDCPAMLRNLMCQCWSTDSGERPEFWEILRSLTKFEHSLDGCGGPFVESRECHRLLPGWLRCE